jgi:mannose-6-phosphate isomerase-like protein (cupin superfamily)
MASESCNKSFFGVHKMITVMKRWGYELWIENNQLYCGKHLHVVPQKWCSVHYHKNKKETFYIIKGELKLQYSTILDIEYWNTESIDMIVLKEGDSITLEPMVAHRFTSNLSVPCDFIEISTHHDDNDSYRIIESF